MFTEDTQQSVLKIYNFQNKNSFEESLQEMSTVTSSILYLHIRELQTRNLEMCVIFALQSDKAFK